MIPWNRSRHEHVDLSHCPSECFCGSAAVRDLLELNGADLRPRADRNA